jgi:tetratricopeptide (TPR) repeat protein
MKKAVLIFISFFVFSAFGQTDEKALLKQLNQKVFDLVEAAKYDDAFTFAQQSLSLTIKVYGSENAETAIVYSNLGLIQRKRHKYKDSIEQLERAIEIASKYPDSKEFSILSMYDALVLSQFLEGKNKEALETQLITMKYAESKYGVESKENIISIINLANLYGRTGKFDRADELYLKVIGMLWRKYGKEAPELESIEDSRICVSPDPMSESLKRNKLFTAKRNDLYAEIFGPTPTDSSGSPILDVGDVNGQAISLPKPGYPVEARNKRLSGKFPIRVVIGERGYVLEAKSICGDGPLAEASRNAALAARFSPTLVGGKPAKVRGVITYSFISQ